MREPHEPFAQPVDGVVGFGERAVAAPVPHFPLEAQEYFFGGLHAEADGLAVPELTAAGVGVERELRVYQVAPFFHQPLDAVSAGFFIGREGDDDVTVGHEPFLPVANE